MSPRNQAAFNALMERYNVQRSDFVDSVFLANIEQLFSMQPLLITQIVCLGLGTLTRVPNAIWDPENSMYQFLLLEHIAELLTGNKFDKDTPMQGSGQRRRAIDSTQSAQRNQSSAKQKHNLPIYFQDPAFAPVDLSFIAHILPSSRILTAEPGETGNPSAQPIANHITPTTLLYAPFLTAEVLVPCLDRKEPSLVICADVAVLLHRCKTGRWRGTAQAVDEAKLSSEEAQAVRRWIAVFEEFLAKYEGAAVEAVRGAKWEEAFKGLMVYRRSDLRVGGEEQLRLRGKKGRSSGNGRAKRSFCTPS